MMLKKFATLCGAGLFALFSMAGAVYADDDNDDDANCPVGLVTGKTLDEEFGAGAEAITRCLKKTKKIKLVLQVNKFCRDAGTNIATCRNNRGYALGNLRNIIKDYEITHGLKLGKGYQIAAVVHSGGGFLLTKHDVALSNPPYLGNQFESQVADLIAQGVKFYYCQNTVRGFIRAGRLTEGMVTEQLIDGVEFVTAGISALGDFQSDGWSYVQP